MYLQITNIIIRIYIYIYIYILLRVINYQLSRPNFICQLYLYKNIYMIIINITIIIFNNIIYIYIDK